MVAAAISQAVRLDTWPPEKGTHSQLYRGHDLNVVSQDTVQIPGLPPGLAPSVAIWATRNWTAPRPLEAPAHLQPGLSPL